MRSPFVATILAAAACSGGQHSPPAVAPSSAPTTTPPVAEAPPSSSPAPRKDTTTLAAVGLDGAAIDRNADACEDFYQFACGGWIAHTPIPADKPAYVRSFSSIDDGNVEYLHAMLEHAAGDKSAAGKSDKVTGPLGAFYGACMDEATIDKRGLAPIKPLLAQIARVHDGASLTAAAIELHKRGVHALWSTGSTPDMKDVTHVIVGVQQGGLGLPERDFYLRTDETSKQLLAAYEAHLATLLGFTGMSAADSKKAAHDVVGLETSIAKISKTKVEMADPQGTYHRVERAGLAKLAPHLDWDAYFKALELGGAQEVTASSTEFFSGLDALVTSTPPAIWRAYLTTRTLDGLGELLGKDLVAARFQFESALTGQQADEPRWKKCVHETDAALGQLLSQSYVADRFGGDAKSKAQAIVDGISAAMGKNLSTLAWMDDATRAHAIEKLKMMVYQIGYPDAWRPYDWKVEPGKYAEDALAGRWFEIRRDLRKVGKPLDKRDWGMTPPTVNAYYNPQYNTMVFPAGILQPPFFDPKSAVAVNLGAIGMVMGHELTHGFDDQGAQFDGVGNLVDWWTPAVGQQFKAKTQCVIDQYSQYDAVPGTKVNGAQTIGENIADAGGLKLAFGAYRTMRAGASDPIVAGGFDEDQLFFLGFAQSWCMNAKPELLRILAQADEHSPPQWRVNGALSNTAEFATAFRCKAGAKMHPQHACAVW